MARIEVRGLSKKYGSKEAVRDVDLSVEDGELCALLGPSGSGKTTILRCVAGLERPDAGEVYIGGRRVDGVPPRERDVSMVFQSYALFPFMTVRQNIAFPLRVRGYSDYEIDSRVSATSDKLGIAGLLEQSPAKLSGGEQQRVAIARAIIRPTNAFLMDEPLSNLDAPLRAQLRTEIKVLQRELKMTVLYVTHDQVEAMTLADKICLLNQGRILQSGPPLQLYREPLNAFTAKFIGSPPSNLFKGTVEREGGSMAVKISGLSIMVPQGAADRFLQLTGRPLIFSLRPEDIRFKQAEGEAHFEGTVELVETLGASSIVNVRAGEVVLKVLAGPDFRPPASAKVTCYFGFGSVHAFDAQSEERVA